MPDYEGLKNKKRSLIRKALEGSVFIGDQSVPAITTLTEYTEGPPATIGLKTLPTGMGDVGWCSDDGAEFERDTETSDVTSWGAGEPTRSDTTSDVTTMAISCQETNLRTIGLYSGATPTAPDADTGEVRIVYPAQPKPKYYRVLALGVDVVDEGEIYVARFLPNAKVTDYDSQVFASGDDPIMYPVTMTGYLDDDLGYSKMDLFGGPGWNALLLDMGFAVAPTLTAIEPATGAAAGGTAVTLTGSGFTDDATVTIGGTAATNVVVVSSTSITCDTPAGAAGAQDVVVTTPHGSATLTGGFTYS